jgi:flagellar protein FlbT
MALKLELKAGERLLLGDCVVVNEGGRTRLSIEGNAPVLREKDLVVPGKADSAAKRLCLALQCMYLSKRPERFLADYARVSREIVIGFPQRRGRIEAIDGLVAAGRLYKAMRAAQLLVQEEASLVA